MTGSVAEYALLTEFTTAGGGQSRWAFAERKGTHYFLKEFLKPKYPVEGAPGSTATKAAQRKACAAFEKHHRGIQEALRPLSSSGGNLVITTDFFRAGSRYYKVTEKVEVTDWSPRDVARLPARARLLLMLTVAHSLNVLHRAGLVHGDIKPPNILIKRLGKGDRFSSKLIDFDNAVLTGEPLPPPDQLVGDMAYYSPELVRYMNDAAGTATLMGASDIFALGLVYSEWLTGERPPIDPDDRYAGVAVARGKTLGVEGVEPPEMAELIGQMLLDPPDERPTAEKVHAKLRSMRGAIDAASDSDTGPGPGPETEGGGLRGSLLGKSAPGKPSSGASPLRSSSLRGSLSRKRSP